MCGVDTKQARQVLRASMAVQSFAAGYVRVALWLSTLFHEKGFSALFLNGSKVLQSVEAKKKAAAKTILPKSIPTMTEALLRFQGIENLNSCLHNQFLYSRIGAAVQMVRRAWSALLKPNGLRNLRTAYWPYFIYDSRTATLHDLTACSDGSSLRSERESLHWVERPVKTEGEAEKAAWKRSSAGDHAMRILPSQLFRHLHALFAGNSWYTLDDDMLW